ncbi:minor capsid protein [Mycetocola spongiae]|uniref:minor capsid protein n=1 Tax=Mycetocola spongiae TaxID=2859226 RepID=UPI001CF567E9|nr:minor capsid protein [Mycetocola spongiae]UCR89248.1 minor capsid protein [Mycetocola spongiae]
MSTSTDLLEGLARLVHAGGAFVFRPEGVYLPGEAPITFGSLHGSASPALCLTEYTPAESRTRAAHALIQARVRAPSYLAGVRLGDELRGLLHDLSYLSLGAVRVSKITRISTAHLGPDSSGRHEWAHNFQLLYTRSVTPSKETTHA